MNSVSEGSCILGCDTMLMDEWFLMFQRNIVSSSFEQSHKALMLLQNVRNHFPNAQYHHDSYNLCSWVCV